MQSFSFNLTNTGTTTINAEQVALGLTLYNTAGTATVTIPSDAVVNVTTQSGSIVWSGISTGQTSVLGYENVVSSGIFAVLGILR